MDTSRLEAWAKQLKLKCSIVHLAIQHERTPIIAKIIGGLTVAYAISPIDLIPDFIPILGYLDDVLIVPVGVYITVKLIPSDVWNECEERAKREHLGKLPKV